MTAAAIACHITFRGLQRDFETQTPMAAQLANPCLSPPLSASSRVHLEPGCLFQAEQVFLQSLAGTTEA